MSASTAIQVRVLNEDLDILDQYRREQADPPTRSKALRELARMALRSLMSPRNEPAGTVGLPALSASEREQMRSRAGAEQHLT